MALLVEYIEVRMQNQEYKHIFIHNYTIVKFKIYIKLKNFLKIILTKYNNINTKIQI